LDDYIADKLKDFDSYSEPNWIDLEDLEELIAKKADEGYELFVVDTFSRIHWNLDASSSRTSQNRCMEELQELVQKLNVAVVMLHHTNRQWTFEGSQKIKDLSNVFKTIQKEESETWSEYRRYILSKDKFVRNKFVDAVYNMWRYEKFYN
jgi:predicted ATP-dependent serine protease